MTGVEIIKKVIGARPEFGNQAHIDALKKAEAQDEFEALPKCPVCDGERECSKCQGECSACDGTGKNWKEWQEWKEKHPGAWPDFR